MIKSILSSLDINLKSWKTKRKIVVFESDDWGSIRMPSRLVYEKALSAGYRVDLNKYEKYDCLLSEKDLTNLYSVLRSFKDKNGIAPIITTNCVVANPNFEKIRENGFSRYEFEYLPDTFKRYPNHKESWNLWQKGIQDKLIYPQYHAREHLNVSLFMSALKRQDSDALWGFHHGMPGMIKKGSSIPLLNPYVEATRFLNEEDLNEKMKIYFDGLKTFEQLFAYKSQTIIPTNYLWDAAYDHELIKAGVVGMQGAKLSTNPLIKRKEKRYTGKRKSLFFADLVRNNRFEPTLSNDRYLELKSCLKKLTLSFMLNSPAIISIHRLNFSGEIFEENRRENLSLLYDLLEKILMRWPDVEFLSSRELAEEILGNNPSFLYSK